MTSHSIFGVAADLALGEIEPPADPEYPAADRWTWIGGLYASPEWGLITLIPDLPPIAVNHISTACSAMATRTSDRQQWQAIDTLAHVGLSTAPAGSGLSLAWSAVLDTCTDAFDDLAGNEFGGSEAIVGAVAAVHRQHSNAVAARFTTNAIDAWIRQLSTHSAGAA